MKRLFWNIKQFKKPNKSPNKKLSPITTQLNILPNTSLKYSKTNTLNMSERVKERIVYDKYLEYVS